jgi:hypothetical protein
MLFFLQPLTLAVNCESDYLSKSVDKVHQVIDNLIHAVDYRSDNDGSNHHDNRALDQLTLGRPGGLVPEFGVRLLDIRQ